MPALLRILAVLLVVAIAREAGAQSAFPFIQVRDGIFSLQDGDRAGVVLVAPDGILIASPLSLSAGQSLRRELAARFPGRPVRFVIYTAPTFEQAAGASAFPDATFVGHAQFNSALLKTGRALPASLTPLDANHNQQLEPSEWPASPLSQLLTIADRNVDRLITASEISRVPPLAQSHFRDQATLSLGTKQVQILHPRDGFLSPAVFFPEERVVYIDAAYAGAPTGFTFGDGRPRDIVDWLRRVVALPFDTVITNRGDTTSREAVADALRHAEALMATAVDTYSRGASVEQAAGAAALQKYGGTPAQAQRRTNIAAIFRSLRVTRTELQGAALVRWMPPAVDYCDGYQNCVNGGHLIGGGGGLRITKSRFGVLLEAAATEQLLAHREGELDDEAYAQRSVRGSLLFRLGTNRPTAFSIDVLAGPSVSRTETSGVIRVKEALPPFAGRHPIAERASTVGATVGVNLVAPLTRAINIVFPLRATVWSKPPTSRWPEPMDLEGGVGFSIRLTQRVH